MTKEELIQNMVDILQEKGGHCLESELLEALKTKGIEIRKTFLDDIILQNPTVFSKTSVTQESEVRLAGVETMPKSVTNNTIDKLPTGKVGLPENQNKRK